MKQVGLFGAYHYGSFGDDLMAVIFGRAVRKTGRECTIFAAEPSIAKEARCNVEADFDRFLENSDIFIFGGGGMFLTCPDPDAVTQFDLNIQKLLDHAQRNGKKVCCFSVGGDTKSKPSLTRGRERLLYEADFISFRNINDRIYMDLRDKPSERADDIVWMTGELFNIHSEYDNASGFGIDLAAGTFSSRVKRFATVKILSSLGHKSTVFKLQHVNKRKKAAKQDEIVYTTITQVLSDIAKNQFVIASRLHFGMAAWSIGVPALLISPVAKARIAWSEAGLEKYIYDSLFSLISSSHITLKKHEHYNEQIAHNLEKKKLAASKHFDYLESCLNRYL